MKRLSMEGLKDYVESEGLGYAVLDGVGLDSLPADEELLDRWQEAKDAMERLEEYLESND